VRIAFGAERSRPNNGLFPRDAVNTYIKKTAENKAKKPRKN